MDDQENTLFERFEKDTKHQFIMKLTQITARISGLLIVSALILLSLQMDKFGHPVFKTALVSLFITLLCAIAEELVRRRIQKQVNRELRQQ